MFADTKEMEIHTMTWDSPKRWTFMTYFMKLGMKYHQELGTKAGNQIWVKAELGLNFFLLDNTHFATYRPLTAALIDLPSVMARPTWAMTQLWQRWTPLTPEVLLCNLVPWVRTSLCRAAAAALQKVQECLDPAQQAQVHIINARRWFLTVR